MTTKRWGNKGNNKQEKYWLYILSNSKPNGPLYPFGYGLSYSEFSVSAPSLSSKTVKQGQSLDASVDRTRLNAGESVELTLESDDVTQFGKPDLREDAQHSVSEHKEIDDLLTELYEMDFASTGWLTRRRAGSSMSGCPRWAV